MSVCVTVRTKNRVSPKEIFDCMLENSEQFIITSDEFPCLKFGTIDRAIRGVEVNEEENGYEVRVNANASIEDYRLFRRMIKYMVILTKGRAYLEDDDESPVGCPLEFFDEKWIQRERKSCFEIVRTMTVNNGHQITMPGLFCNFSVGFKMYRDFGIPLEGKCSMKKITELQDYLCDMQWYLANKTGTHTRLTIKSPN